MDGLQAGTTTTRLEYLVWVGQAVVGTASGWDDDHKVGVLGVGWAGCCRDGFRRNHPQLMLIPEGSVVLPCLDVKTVDVRCCSRYCSRQGTFSPNSKKDMVVGLVGAGVVIGTVLEHLPWWRNAGESHRGLNPGPRWCPTKGRSCQLT
ncbi:hypothetical protein Pcinc_022567 [Petrolisthes cinctipes]|uniref:Uncharacterized protein n=1 Tax=Petrolisthes cinctipes TaxID=88211 RepID=A0AAE1KI32_PETCI|nr:hypothetical protein Pcinc_022567 [Petrolisthes cinctipes]